MDKVLHYTGYLNVMNEDRLEVLKSGNRRIYVSHYEAPTLIKSFEMTPGTVGGTGNAPAN